MIEPNDRRRGASLELQAGLRWADKRRACKTLGQPGLNDSLPARPRRVRVWAALRPLRGGGWSMLPLVSQRGNKNQGGAVD